MSGRAMVILAFCAALPLMVWPAFATLRWRSDAAAGVVAPSRDYALRNRVVAFYERRVATDPEDQISLRLLGDQYLQRYRENGDVADIERAVHQGIRSLRAAGRARDAGAHALLASAYTALHWFTAAEREEAMAAVAAPSDANAPAQLASLEMELGRYEAARAYLVRAERFDESPTTLAIRARLDELTGRLATARILLDRAIADVDSQVDMPAQGRAWFHVRAGELAFSAGDVMQAEQDERDALQVFPHDEMAWRALARFCWGSKDWHCANDAAGNAMAIAPLPESIGYQADALRALGQTARAQEDDALIGAVERLGNAYHLNDRLLAVYYAEHHERVADAFKIAEREAAVRGNEVYAQDTLAWAAAMAGQWDRAVPAIKLAVRYDTEDPRIQFHAGVIALHFGDRPAGMRRLRRSLALSAQFNPAYADDARALLRASDVSRACVSLSLPC